MSTPSTPELARLWFEDFLQRVELEETQIVQQELEQIHTLSRLLAGLFVLSSDQLRHVASRLHWVEGDSLAPEVQNLVTGPKLLYIGLESGPEIGFGESRLRQAVMMDASSTLWILSAPCVVDAPWQSALLWSPTPPDLTHGPRHLLRALSDAASSALGYAERKQREFSERRMHLETARGVTSQFDSSSSTPT